MNFQEAYNRLKKQVENLGIFKFDEKWSEAECVTAFESAENKNIAAIEDANKNIGSLQDAVSALTKKVESFESAGFIGKDAVATLITESIKTANDSLSENLKKDFAGEVAEIKKLAVTAGTVVTGDGATPLTAIKETNGKNEEEMVEVKTKIFNQDTVIKVPKSSLTQQQK